MNSEKHIEKKKGVIDFRMAVNAPVAKKLRWHTADDPMFRLEGFAFRKSGGPFRRLPANSEARHLSANVDKLSDMTAGGTLHFRTDSGFIQIRAEVATVNNTGDIMTCGRCGFDLYDESGYISNARLNFDELTSQYSYSSVLFERDNPHRELHDFQLNFPLYAKVLSFSIGFSPDSILEKPMPRFLRHPILLYGTSIEQGCCAGRPGMCVSNLLARRMKCEVLNFGFAGSGLGEPEIAMLLADIPNPGACILAYDANVSAERLKETLTPFCRILLERHPGLPILTVSLLRMPGEREFFTGDQAFFSVQREARTRIHMENSLHFSGNVHFLDGATVFGENYAEVWADGCHPNDLGMWIYADAMAKALNVQGFLRE